jgi:hypothetical protein
MQIAYNLLFALIGLSPLFLVADSLIIHGVLTAYIATTMFIVARLIRPGEADYLSKIIRPALVLASIPAIWMLVQALPLPIDSVQSPIWASAQAALNKQIVGSISIDPGRTLVSFARYLSACGLFFVAIAVTIDRQRAETVLFWLAAMTTVMATLLIIYNLGGFWFLGENSSIGPRASITGATTLGTVLTAATVICAVERYETRRSRIDVNRRLFVAIMIAATCGFVLCWIAILFFMSGPLAFAAICGVGTFFLMVGYRRLGLESRFGLVLAAVAVGLPLSIVARTAMANKLDLTLRFNADAPRSLVEIAQRMITDTNWLGSGAGAFPDLLPIYQPIGDIVTASLAPTTSAGLLIEQGPLAFWSTIIIAVGTAVWFIRGALQRGRDSFFPAAAASCVVVLLTEAFIDASLSGNTVIVLAMTTLGLGLSQSESRSSR